MGAAWDGVPDFLDVAVRDLNGLNKGILSNMQEEEELFCIMERS